MEEVQKKEEDLRKSHKHHLAGVNNFRFSWRNPKPLDVGPRDSRDSEDLVRQSCMRHLVASADMHERDASDPKPNDISKGQSDPKDARDSLFAS